MSFVSDFVISGLQTKGTLHLGGIFPPQSVLLGNPFTEECLWVESRPNQADNQDKES